MPRSSLLLLSSAFCLLTSPVLGVTTSHWTHTTEADFKKGSFHNVVATNLGDLKLSRAVKTLLDQDPKVSSVYCLAEAADHTIYAGTGPQGALLQIKDDKVTTVLTLDNDSNILSLLIDKDGRLLIGTGGDEGKILAIDHPGDKPKEIFKAKDVQYIWKMVEVDDHIYVATGPNGQLFDIAPDGTNTVLFKSNENNLLSMISDKKDLLYIGTDPDGLVYRINRKTKEKFVMYDAAESEIAALALDDKGNLYAATAQTEESGMTGAADEATTEKTGRPEAGSTAVPIPGKAPENPQPPKLPDPNPGEPAPIPKTASPSLLKGDGRGDGRPRGDAAAQINSRAPFHPLFLLDDPDPSAPAPNPNPPEIQLNMARPATQPSKAPTSADNAPPKPEGNAIYRIDRDGFVTEIFRQTVEIHSMIYRNGDLLLGTGSEGLIYDLNPSAEEYLIIAKVDPKEVTSLLAASDGRIILGCANTGQLSAMSAGYADGGTYTSPVLDATQVSRFGKIHLEGSLPKSTTLTIATRSGNVQDPADTGWSDWTKEAPAVQFADVNSPSSRYLQYRLTFNSTDSDKTPVIEDIDVAYQTPNMSPVIKSVKIADLEGADESPSSDKPSAANASSNSSKPKPSDDRHRTITWDASDPNNDTLSYSLSFRQGARSPWIVLKDKLKDATYDWDTRSVADGRYQIKVTASDAQSNPPGAGKIASRVSDPFIIDNTPPTIGDLQSTTAANKATITFRAVDRTTTIAGCKYAIDSNEEWQSVLPTDGIFDSAEEQVSFTTAALTPGAHQITLSATDSHGNEAFETVMVTIPSPTASK